MFAAPQGLEVLQVDARVLPAPPLKYEKEFGAPSLGSWNLKQLRFQEAANITSYGVASFAPERFYGSPGPEGFPVSPPFKAGFQLIKLSDSQTYLCDPGILLGSQEPLS